MNIIEILRERLEAVPAGDHSVGLRAVLQHVEVAVAHLTRGQVTREETAFTDAIYRTNQAFEGSLKEAYRVLAGKDPSKLRPFDIETYFQQSASLRPRVVAQFRNYRTEWRNPAAHDHRVDFDEDEALLAIVSVCAFAIVLTDQITEKLSFNAARATSGTNLPVDDTGQLFPRTIQLLRLLPLVGGLKTFALREAELIGAVAGFLSSAMPDVQIIRELRGAENEIFEVDLILMKPPEEEVLIEVKRSEATEATVQRTVEQVSRYMEIGRLKEAIIYFHPRERETEMVVHERQAPNVGGRVSILVPARKTRKS